MKNYQHLRTSECFDIGALLLSIYPEFVLKTAKPTNRHEGFEALDDKTALRVLAYTGLVGEAGEVSEVFKKYFLHGKPYDRDALIKEMGDVMWYFILMCEVEGISFSEIVETNMLKLAARHLENPVHAAEHEFFKRLLGQRS